MNNLKAQNCSAYQEVQKKQQRSNSINHTDQTQLSNPVISRSAQPLMDQTTARRYVENSYPTIVNKQFISRQTFKQKTVSQSSENNFKTNLQNKSSSKKRYQNTLGLTPYSSSVNGKQKHYKIRLKEEGTQTSERNVQQTHDSERHLENLNSIKSALMNMKQSRLLNRNIPHEDISKLTTKLSNEYSVPCFDVATRRKTSMHQTDRANATTADLSRNSNELAQMRKTSLQTTKTTQGNLTSKPTIPLLIRKLSPKQSVAGVDIEQQQSTAHKNQCLWGVLGVADYTIPRKGSGSELVLFGNNTQSHNSLIPALDETAFLHRQESNPLEITSNENNSVNASLDSSVNPYLNQNQICINGPSNKNPYSDLRKPSIHRYNHQGMPPPPHQIGQNSTGVQRPMSACVNHLNNAYKANQPASQLKLKRPQSQKKKSCYDQHSYNSRNNSMQLENEGSSSTVGNKFQPNENDVDLQVPNITSISIANNNGDNQLQIIRPSSRCNLKNKSNNVAGKHKKNLYADMITKVNMKEYKRKKRQLSAAQSQNLIRQSSKGTLGIAISQSTLQQLQNVQMIACPLHCQYHLGAQATINQAGQLTIYQAPSISSDVSQQYHQMFEQTQQMILQQQRSHQLAHLNLQQNNQNQIPNQIAQNQTTIQSVHINSCPMHQMQVQQQMLQQVHQQQLQLQQDPIFISNQMVYPAHVIFQEQSLNPQENPQNFEQAQALFLQQQAQLQQQMQQQQNQPNSANVVLSQAQTQRQTAIHLESNNYINHRNISHLAKNQAGDEKTPENEQQEDWMDASQVMSLQGSRL